MPICYKCNQQSDEGKYLPTAYDEDLDEGYEEVFICDDCLEND
jgi:hypothetical protein